MITKKLWIPIEVLFAVGLYLVILWNLPALLGPTALRAIRETAGRNFLGHALMLALPALFLLAGAKKLRDYGWNFERLAMSVDIGLHSFIWFAMTSIPLFWLGTDTWKAAAVVSLLTLACLFPLSRILRKAELKKSASLRKAILFTAASIGFAIAFRRPQPGLLDSSLDFLYFFFFVGFGEEFFFRGYLLGRLNDAFGGRYAFCGIQFGIGLPVSSLVFGLMHSINAGFNPFIGDFRLAIWWSVWTAFGGLFLGLIRERTGGILGCAIAHGFPLAVLHAFNVL